MNIISTTANKVMELEKRIDNQLTDKSIRVSEVTKTIESYASSETMYDVLTFDAKTDLSVVVQGELDIQVEGETHLDISLILDGFEVYSKQLAIFQGEHSVSIMKAMNIASGTSQKLVMRVSFDGVDEVYVKGFSFFVWGYGESLELGVSSSEPKLSATEKNGRCAICFSLDGRAFVCYKDTFPENLSFDDFSYLGEFSYVEPIYVEDGDSQNLLLFAVSDAGHLIQFSGEVSGVELADGVKIDEDVVSVSATKVKTSDEVVVVYAKNGGEINYFSLIDGARSEIMNLATYDEKVSEVSLIHNCDTTTFLVVGLESGRSYLYSSVTAVAWSDKLSHIFMNMEVSYT